MTKVTLKICLFGVSLLRKGGLVRVQSTKNFGVDRLKILVYGEAGRGKTSLAKTIGEPALVISAEAGLLSIKDADIDVIDVSTDDEGTLLPKEQRIVRVEEAYRYICGEDARAKYKWIFIDSITEIAQNLVEYLQAEYPNRKDALVMWGQYSSKMRGLIKAFRDIPYYNVVMTALTETDKDENGSFKTGIAVNGKISQALPGFFDEVFYYHLGKDSEGAEVRKLLTQPTDTIMAKDRSGKLERLEDPCLSTIANKIRGEN